MTKEENEKPGEVLHRFDLAIQVIEQLREGASIDDVRRLLGHKIMTPTADYLDSPTTVTSCENEATTK